MAKGARNKVKKRLRVTRAAHLYEVRGKFREEEMSRRQYAPNNYDYLAAHHMPPNAFVEPNNPLAVFPQILKPDKHLVDFRSQKMIGGGITGRNNARKMYSSNAKKSKYTSVCVGPEELAEIALAKAAEEAGKNHEDMDVEELAAMADKLNLGKKPKAEEGGQIDMGMPSISVKSKAIRKKGCVKSRRQMTF
jgi:hypothetical protein